MKIKEFAQVINGSTPSSKNPQYYDGDIVWFTPKDLATQNKKYVSVSERTISEKGYKSCSTSMLPPGSVLMSSRAPIGLLAITTVPCCTNQGFKSFILDTEKCNPEYLYYYLKYHIKEIESLGSGTTFKEVSKPSIEEYEVDLPSLEKQKKTIEILSIIDSKIQNNNKQIQTLESLAKTIYDYWFVQFDFPNEDGKPYKSSGGKMVWNEELKREIPEGWSTFLLDGKIRFERGISYSSEDIAGKVGTPMINLANIDKHRNYRVDELKIYNKKLSESSFVKGGDLLIACTDLTRNADIVGCPIVVPYDDKKYCYSMDLAKIIVESDEIIPLYLYMTLRTNFYHSYIKKWASGTNVLHLDLDGIEWYRIYCPGKELQKKYANIVASIRKGISNLEKENNELKKIKDFLLPLLMNGQVHV